MTACRLTVQFSLWSNIYIVLVKICVGSEATQICVGRPHKLLILTYYPVHNICIYIYIYILGIKLF